ncbi:MAG: precorrin-6A reductase [Desulfomonilaceae bacterium]|nr:precorrin-6A reductase [Desulfomonilaceae bacterium]
MILLIGGTSETGPLASALAQLGWKVLVSTATDVPLDVGCHPNVAHRSGKLDEEAMAQLISERGVRVVVDASHPYASTVRSTARKVCQLLGVPYVSFVRPPAVEPEDFIRFASDHEHAAAQAFAFGRPVLLTTGSRNLAPYAAQASRTGIDLIVRVLAHPDSVNACLHAGIPKAHILTGRGPFSTQDNRSVIRRFGIGCLVTKDSGIAGGVPEKIEAARLEKCRVVVVGRPDETDETSCSTFDELISMPATLVPDDRVATR